MLLVYDVKNVKGGNKNCQQTKMFTLEINIHVNVALRQHRQLGLKSSVHQLVKNRKLRKYLQYCSFIYYGLIEQQRNNKI